MGLFSQALAGLPTGPTHEDPTAGGEFSKGISRGLRNTGSGFLEAGALGAESLGLPTVQQGLRSGAKSLRDEAASPEFAAEAPTFDEAQGVGQTLRWGVGKAGEMVPLIAGAVAGGVIAKNPFIGGTAALAPVSVGDIAQRQYDDPTVAAQPVGERGLRALGGGVAASALTNIPFGGMMGRGLGAGASKTLAGALTKNVGEGVVTGGVGMGSGEAVKQLATNPDAAFNTDQISDAAIGGAVTMGAMHVPVAGVSYARGKAGAVGDAVSSARTSIKDRLASTKEAAVEATAPATQKLSSFSDDLGDSISKMVSKSREKYDDVADKIMSGELLGTTKEAITGMTPERVKEAIDFSDNETVKTVTKWGNDMLSKAGLDDAKRTEITDALANVKDRASQVTIAGLKKASDLGDKAMQKIDKFAATVKEGYTEQKAADGTKKSEDTSGARQIILDVLDESGLKDKRPDLFASSKHVNEMADALRVMVEDMSRGPLSSDKLSAATDVFGETTASVMSAIRKTLGEVDPTKTESFFKNLNEIHNIEKSGKGLHDTMFAALTDEAKASGAQHSIGEHADVLLKHARGFDLKSGEKPTEQHKFFDTQVQDYYDRTFGPKADAVRKAVEKEALRRKTVDETPKVDEDGLPLEEAETDTMKFGLSKPDARGKSKSELDGLAMPEDSRYARQHLLDLKAKYPEHDVRFERLPGSDHGHIIVEQRADPGKFNDADLASMTHDTKKYPDSPSRLKVGDHNIDAVKVASVMKMKGQKDFEGPGNETSALKTANAFKAGIAQLTEQFGQKIDVPDSAVIGRVGGKPLTWGEAKKLKSDTAENRMSKSGQEKLAAMDASIKAMREEYKGANPKRQKELINEAQEIAKDERTLIEFEKARELSGDQDTPTSSQAASARSQRKAQRFGYESKPHDNGDGRFDAEGNLTKEGARLMLEGAFDGGLNPRELAQRKLHGATEDGAPKETGENRIRSYERSDQGQGRSDVSADENSHLVAAVHGKDMKRAANMDGSPHFIGDKISRADGQARNALTMTIGDWRDAGEPEALINRAQTLLSNIDKMSRKDARRLTDLAGKNSDQAKLTLNNLARTYKDQITAPGVKGEGPIKAKKPSTDKRVEPDEYRDGGAESSNAVETALHEGQKKPAILEQVVQKHRDYLDNPPDDYTTEKVQTILDWATKQEKRVMGEVRKLDLHRDDPAFDQDRYDAVDDLAYELRSLMKDAKDQIQNDKDMAEADIKNGTNLFGMNPDKPGSAPNPKPVAAKKAAFLERAASGDKTLIKELSESNDAKGLQRAAEALITKYADSLDEDGHLRTAIDAANARLSELIQNPDVAYGLGTKKYSLETTHVSNTRHDGVFDWRKNWRTGQTEAKAGAGTYLMPADAHSSIANFKGLMEQRMTPKQFSATEGKFAEGKPAVYATRLDAEPHEIMLWDEKFSKQPKEVQEALLKVARELGVPEKQIAEIIEKDVPAHEIYGYDLYNRVFSLPEVSNALDRAGIVGAKYRSARGPEFVVYRDSRISTDYVHFDKTKTDPARNNAQDPGVRAAIKDHLTKVLGNSVRTSWATFTHAGEYTHAQGQGLIRLSVHALDPMSTAYHESLHAFFAQLRDGGAHDITGVLEKAASSEHVLAQLKERYKNEPGVLRQLADPEERAAYMYQTWAVDPTFKVSIAAKGVFGKIADMIRNALGLWSNDQRALHIMDYFHSGEYAKNMSSISGVRHALMDSHRSQILDSAKAVAEPLGRLADAVVGTGSARLRDTGIPALNRLADAIKRDGTTEGGDQGFIQASKVARTQRLGALADKLAPYTPEQLNDALEGLQKATVPVSAEGRLAARAIKGVLAETKAYMEAAGVKIRDLGPDYFPRVWDTHYISKNQQAFRDMLEPYIRRGEMLGTADQLIKNLATRDGNEFGIETREPGMQFKKERLLTFISHADAAQFMQKDLYGTLGSYITQATRKAEWSRRLGNGKLEALMQEAKDQGATPEQVKTAEQYLKGIDGTLGDSLNPHARRVMGNMIVYQNIRLLPMAAFSMLIDPNGVMVRGGTMSDAWKTFKRGISEIPQSYGRVGKKDRAAELAELTGVIDNAIMTHTMGDLYTQGMVGGTAQKLNNAFFKYNMVEGLNRSFRIGASEAAMSFMARHSDLKNSVHSRRWMAELGIQKGDIIKTADGRIALTEAEGLTKAQVQRVHAAVNQWVDGAILRPDAADKPIWMNDPRFALVSHLKQFVFSFQKTILERVAHEFRNGNYTPAMALASYVPVMMAADFVKGMVANGGGTPDWQAGWDISDYIAYGMQRAGLFGVAQFGLDIAKDMRHGNTGAFALLGPTIEQARDGVEALSGHKQFGSVVLKALPANALYSHQFGGKGSEPSSHDE